MTAPTAPDVSGPSASASGRSATERFARKERLTAGVDQARVSAVATDAITALHEVVRRHHLTYEEYDALKAWLIRVGQDGEWPLFLDVWVEHVVEEVVNADRLGTSGTIEGPYYIPGAPEFAGAATLPMRDGEEGTPFVFQGTVSDLDGTPLESAVVELWHADDDGYYSQFAPDIPEWNLRGAIITGADGRFAFTTVKPAPYQIPTDGACGALIAAAGWHAWRPAHLHLKVTAPGKQLITTQLYFEGGDYLDTDIAQAVKPELILHPGPAASGNGEEVTYDFVLDPAA